jgi:hypothetical protein
MAAPVARQRGWDRLAVWARFRPIKIEDRGTDLRACLPLAGG